MVLRWILPGLLFLLMPSVHAGAQESIRTRFDDARLAWDQGDYVEALVGLDELLQDPEAVFLHPDIARLTGEPYQVSEITTDGRAVRWSPDGGLAAYESGSGSETVTHVLRVGPDGPEEIFQWEGSGLVFSPDGREAALLVLDETEALLAARARLREEIVPTDRAGFMRLRAETARLEALYTEVVLVDLDSGEPRVVGSQGVGVEGLLYGPGKTGLFFVGSQSETVVPRLFRVNGDSPAEAVFTGVSGMDSPFFAGDRGVLVFGVGPGSFGVGDLATDSVRTFEGVGPVASSDGSSLAFLSNEGGEGFVNVLSLTDPRATPTVVARAGFRLGTMTTQACPACPLLTGLTLSPDGSQIVYQGMPREDWELFLVPVGAVEGEPKRFTREIQHDLFPHFLGTGLLLAMKGEGRHRRSFLYDPQTGEGTRLFRNNTLRTVAPEYEWAPSPDGTKLLIVAERDGNTVSPERGVYLVDLSQPVGKVELLDRVRTNLDAERALRQKAEKTYGPLMEEIGELVDQVSLPRLFGFEEALFGFGSKYISEPGNRMAMEYLAEKLMEFGIDPELQWFEPRGARTANIVARIPGTVSPDVVYAVSAHFDSNRRSPGADDNTSATVGLLEMARILADHPLPATVEIVFFTGEEAGLLGSREYVRRAVASEKKLVGALNNDMIGWAENHRLDNTIRYSNDGIRDVQHGAAILFSDMITYDAKYYKSTDAAAYYDAYGDIVGGIGSYPILANPHYHQVHDILETVNHQLVAEVAKTTIASIALMTSSPSRLTGLSAQRGAGVVTLGWDPSVESDVSHYEVALGDPEDPTTEVRVVEGRSVELGRLTEGMVVAVRAVNRRGLKGWDWARTTVD